MNKLKVFQNEKFGEVRIEIVNGKEMFCANDVAKALGYKRPADAVAQHCKGSVKYRIPTNGGSQLTKFIPESLESLKKDWFDVIEDKEVI